MAYFFFARPAAFLPRLAALRLPAFLRVALAFAGTAAPDASRYLVPRFCPSVLSAPAASSPWIG